MSINAHKFDGAAPLAYPASHTFKNVKDVLLSDGRRVKKIFAKWEDTYAKVYEYHGPRTYELYGFKFDSGASTAASAITYLEDAVGKTPAGMNMGGTITTVASEIESGAIAGDGTEVSDSTCVRMVDMWPISTAKYTFSWTSSSTLLAKVYAYNFMTGTFISELTNGWTANDITLQVTSPVKIRVMFRTDPSAPISSSIVTGMTLTTVPYFSYGDWADAFFMPRPCMLKYDGTVDYYLDPDNYNVKADDGSIPAGYKAVEYIETMGTQYINTDILINSYTDTVVDAKFYFDGAKEDSPYGGYLFGATDDSSTGIMFSANTTDWNNVTTFWCGFPYKISSSTDWIYNIRSVILNRMSYYHFSLADLHCNAIDGHLAINGMDQALTVRPTPQTSTLPTSTLTIFGNNSNGTVTVYPFAGLRLYRFTITEKVNNVNTVTHNLIPAERQSDGELGLYDTVTGDFYTNSGTGTFLKGGYGIASDIEREAYPGNAMMEWPKIWYKFEAGENAGEGYFYVSDTKVDNTYHCWCNYDIQDNEIDHFYTSIYHGSNDGRKMRSLSGWNSDYPAPRYKTVADLAVANNINGYEEWNTETFADRQLVDALVMLIGKTADPSAVFGKGIYGQSNVQSAVTGYTMGSLNDKGLFWGDTSSGDHAVKIFGMENWWGLMPHTVAGVHISGTTLYYKLTPGQADGSTVTGFKERTWSGSTDVESGYLQKTIPSGVGGANTGYISAFDFSDGIYFMSELAQSVTKFNQNCTRPNTFFNYTKLLAFGAIAGSDTPNGIGKMEAYQYYNGWNVCGLSCKPIAAESSTTTQTTT